MHTDYGALGCVKVKERRLEIGDSISGHRPETTCPECRANLIREGGMRPEMFYGYVAPVIHMLDPSGEEGLCGAELRPMDSDEQDWTEERHEVTCTSCAERYDEAGFEQDEERRLEQAGIAAHDRAADRYIDDHRG